MYFSWLGTYTRALFVMSILGNVVMMAQFFFGSVVRQRSSL
eukprot:SAG22_NODE_632_length_8376_cov_4.201160_3_plen_41_part_00